MSTILDIFGATYYHTQMSLNPQIAALGTEIRARRRRLGLTQSRLAAMTDLSRASVNALESGTTDLGLAKVIRVAVVLGMDLRFERRTAKHEGWLQTAATSASASYRKTVPTAVIAQAAKTAQVPADYLPHIATLLEEASPTLLVRALSEIFPKRIPKEAWDNLAKISKAAHLSRPFLQ